MNRSIPTLAVATLLALGIAAHSPPTTVDAWTAILCDPKTGETRTPDSFPGDKEYYAWKKEHNARELKHGEECKKKHYPPKHTATPTAVPTSPPSTPTAAPTQPVQTPTAQPTPVAPAPTPQAPVAPPQPQPPTQGRGEGGSPQRFAYCVYINTGKANTSGWAYREGSEGDLGPGGLYSGYEAQGLAYRSVDSRFNFVPGWDKYCKTPPPLPEPVTYRPATVPVAAPVAPVVPVVPQIDVPVYIEAPHDHDAPEAPVEAPEAPVVPEVVPDLPPADVTPPVAPEAPRDESNPASPWFNGSTVPGGDKGEGRG